MIDRLRVTGLFTEHSTTLELMDGGPIRVMVWTLRPVWHAFECITKDLSSFDPTSVSLHFIEMAMRGCSGLRRSCGQATSIQRGKLFAFTFLLQSIRH